MAKEVKDITKSFSSACESCSEKNNCPYTDKNDCIDVRSGGSIYDTEGSGDDFQEPNYEDCNR